jgi:glutathione S-transferase
MAALVDSIMDQETDFMKGLTITKYRERNGFESIDDDTNLKVRQALNDRVLPHYLSLFERLLEDSVSGWIANTDGPSIADFLLVPQLRSVGNGQTEGISADILTPFPKVVALIEKFNSLDVF